MREIDPLIKALLDRKYAPANAQKNCDITREEIESKLGLQDHWGKFVKVNDSGNGLEYVNVEPGASYDGDPTVIEQDPDHRFVSDAQINDWDGKADSGHNHDGVYSPVGHTHDYAASDHNHNEAYEPKNTNIQTHIASSHAPSNAQKNSDITKAEIEAKLTGAITSHTHDYAASNHNHSGVYEPVITNGFGITGTNVKAVSLTSASAFATATTTISAATYADITGCSIALSAGTWIIFAHVVGYAANTIIQMFVAITDSANAVISESAMSRPASGTASLNSPVSVSWYAIVAPVSPTTYKLRGARGLTTHTGSWIAMDGNGVNTANHASNNSDKGTGIFAIRIS